ncbi:MAG: glycosyltransferase [Candidatus Abyssobacteria bacterium SURF_17]|uniref:Glycosyltransferase n=1 Tax=Candidatus Abyssobacteria bacterium SURF_17 TaxID=2093361 RepID=A0A419EUM8_9BACT|nr:MAG: glycosyltransferase [Candidatus Abyssubacteria bacterium SURF_17]
MISIVSPCFNEREVLPEFYARLTAAAEKWQEPFEVLLVDDGSFDGTWDLICGIHEKNPQWKAIRFSRNFGHQNAISAGIRYAQGDCVIIIDSDLQDPPEELHRFIAKWKEGREVVYGIRTKRKEGVFKRLCYDAFYKLIGRLANIDIPYGSGDFCLIDRRVADLLNSLPEQNRFVRGLRSWVGFRQEGIEYERSARAAGEAKYTFSKLCKLACDGIFSFSTQPLRIATYLGFAALFLALGGFVVLVLRPAFTGWTGGSGPQPVSAFASMALLMLFLGGVQLICVGILGEYLARIYDQVKGRPFWIVRETLGVSEAQKIQPPL